MAGQTRSANRAHALLEMKIAHGRRMSASAFIRQAQTEGYSYRRADMLADFRSVNQIEEKKGRLKYVRRDYYPTERVIANVEWELSHEYMYTVSVQARQAEGAEIESRFINILSDIPLRPREVEEELYRRWSSYERYEGEVPTEVVVETAYRRV